MPATIHDCIELALNFGLLEVAHAFAHVPVVAEQGAFERIRAIEAHKIAAAHYRDSADRAWSLIRYADFDVPAGSATLPASATP